MNNRGKKSKKRKLVMVCEKNGINILAIKFKLYTKKYLLKY